MTLLSGPDPGPAVDAFYDPPAPLPDGPPGTIIRSEAVRNPPPRSRAYRILYRSRGTGGQPAALSALLFVSTRPAPPNRRDVVALAHGTVGVARGCAVSSGRGFAAQADGLARFMRAGYAVVVPDLEGLGTPGTHPYLIGDATARATLDAVRATRRFAPAAASERFVAWGVGQGGHAALFTGQQAAAYAPELELAGVAAAAPPANLARVLASGAGTPAGDVMAAYVLSTWSRAYPRLRPDDILAASGRTTVERVAGRCVAVDHGRVAPTLDGRAVRLAYRGKAPWRSAPWQARLLRNAPGAKRIPAPVIITQGRDDTLVRPTSTARFARYLCARGTTLQYRPSRGVGHGDVGERTAPYVSRWIARRFAGKRARSTC